MTDKRTPLEVIEDIAHEIITEREDQNAKWGQQNHESSYSEYNRVLYGREADSWKRVNDARVETGRITWDGILLEEVYEALAEADDTKRRAELVQVAAVAAAEIEAIDRRASERALTCPATARRCEKACLWGCGLTAATDGS